MADLPFVAGQRATEPAVAGNYRDSRQAESSLTAGRGSSPTTRWSGRWSARWSGGAEPLERDRLCEFGADLVAGSPFDDSIGAFAPGEHQPHARSDLEPALRSRHEA